jgi:hypothetical protein
MVDSILKPGQNRDRRDLKGFGSAISAISAFQSAVALVTVAIIAGFLPLRAQQTPASRLILAAVNDAQGRPLVDLDPDEFVISEDGQRCEIVASYDADYPVVVLIDNSAEAQKDLEAIRSAVSRFLSRLGDRFVAIGTLTDPPTLLTSFEDERPAVLARLEKLTASPTSVLMPIEAIALATSKVRENGSPFSAIVVVSAHAIDATKPQNTGLLPEIFDSGAMVHVISRISPAAAPGRAPAPRPADLLRDLADQTRGNFTTVFSPPSYSVALNNLADRLGTETMVEYFAPSGSTAPGEVQIGVRIPGAQVRGLRVSKWALQ